MIKFTFFGSVFEILSPILMSRVSINKPYGLILTNAFKTLYRENYFIFFTFCNVYNCICCFYQCKSMKYEVWFRVSKCKPFVFILTNAFKTLL